MSRAWVMVSAPIDDIIEYYMSGATLEECADIFGFSPRTIHSWLVKLGVPTRRTGVPKGYHFSDERNQKLSASRKGWKMSEEQKKLLSDIKKSKYNGLNGYGHVKHHCSGYDMAYCPLHPHATKDGYVMLHTVIMEQHIGRYLENDEVVHHVNRIRSDNDLDNLVLMDKKEHMSMHMKERHSKRRTICNS